MSSKHSPHRASPSKKSTVRTIIIIVCVIACIVSAFLGIRYMQRLQIRKNLVRVSNSYTVVSTPTPTPEPTPEPSEEPVVTPEPTPVPADIPVNLRYMQSLNSDVDGWIVIDDTVIDYPVLYDDSETVYYLDHTRTGQYSVSGSIFVDGYNNRDFEDFLTVLYGHNMRDKSMFGGLHYYKDKDYFNSHDTIVIYTEDRKLTYKIFAAYTRDNDHLLVCYSYDTEEDRQDYIDEIYTHDGIFNYDIEVTPDDHIIALSTCTGWTYTRYIVQAVLVSDEPGVYNGD